LASRQEPIGHAFGCEPFAALCRVDAELLICGLSLGLIGNASGKNSNNEVELIRGIFDEETRRKRVAFAADAVRYGI
jgi:hypothetical protein